MNVSDSEAWVAQEHASKEISKFEFNDLSLPSSKYNFSPTFHGEMYMQSNEDW